MTIATRIDRNVKLCKFSNLFTFNQAAEVVCYSMWKMLFLYHTILLLSMPYLRCAKRTAYILNQKPHFYRIRSLLIIHNTFRDKIEYTTFLSVSVVYITSNL